MTVCATSQARLQVENSSYIWTFSCRCLEDGSPPVSRRPALPATNYALLANPPLIGGHISFPEYATVLSRFAHHHVSLGLNGVLLYLHTHQLTLLAKEPVFSKLWHSGLLTVVRWDQAPGLSTRVSMWVPQRAAIAHAFLAAWGKGVGMLSVDLDEWLLLPAGQTFGQTWERCWHRSNCVEVPRLATYCDGCGARELDMWGSNEDPLGQYNAVTGGDNPVASFKTYAAAWATFPASVHLLYGCSDAHWANVSCAALLHMYNLWGKRVGLQADGQDIRRLDKRTLELKPWVS